MADSVLKAAGSSPFTYRKTKIGIERPDTQTRYFLYLIQSGEATLTYGSRRYSLKGGDLAIALPGHSYTLEAEDGICEADEISLRSYLPSERLRTALKHLPTVQRSDALGARAAELFGEVAAEAKRNDEYSEDSATGLIQALLVAVVRADAAGVVPSEISAPVASAVAHVNAHLGERLTLGDVASVCEVSTAYLSRKFKAEIGIGFADYVAGARLERAATMLREHPELSITEIAFSCGFNDSNYFSDKFKHRFGIPPLRFRKKQ